MTPQGIHILGASGTGTTTLGKSLAQHLHVDHFDTDNFFWLPTNPPFQTIRPREERQRLLEASLASSPSWILSGHLCGWGDIFIPRFTLVIFLSLPQSIRMARLRAREAARYAAAIEPGGSMHQQHLDFIQWASSYDDGDTTMRSRKLHKQWLAGIPSPVLRLDGEMATDVQIKSVKDALKWQIPSLKAERL